MGQVAKHAPVRAASSGPSLSERSRRRRGQIGRGKGIADVSRGSICGAATLAVTGLAGGTQKADAFVTSADYCAGYIYRWNYWGGEVENELIRSNGEATPYFEYAWAQKVAYSRLISIYSC